MKHRYCTSFEKNHGYLVKERQDVELSKVTQYLSQACRSFCEGVWKITNQRNETSVLH